MPKVSRKIERELNESQLEAVSSLDGPLLVLAGAGTGKTRVITYRVANMIENGVPPERVLGLTFTNKAAREMRERLAALVSRESAEKVFLGTFHSFGARFLRSHVGVLGFTSDFTIADEADQVGIMKQAVLDLDLNKDFANPKICRHLASKVKNAMSEPEALEIHDTVLSKFFPAIYKRYNQILKNQNMLDFDDLLFFVVAILERDQEILARTQKRRTHILVDEYQDTNFLQFRLLQLLAGEKRNICVVGDDDQSIYGWRGAEITHILGFADKFPGAKVVKLERNYRSTTTILDGANAVISFNDNRHSKRLWSDLGDGEPIKIIDARTGDEEASFIADAIIDAINGSDRLPPSSIAVLYRSNHLSRLIEESLRTSRIPYKLVGSKSFYDRKEVRDAVAYLKLIHNKRDDQSLLRIIGVPPRGIGDKAIEHLKRIKAESGAPPLGDILAMPEFRSSVSNAAAKSAEKLASTIRMFRQEFRQDAAELAPIARKYLEQVGYLDGLARIHKDTQEYLKRRDNVLELVNAIAQHQARNPSSTLGDFLEAHSLADDSDKVHGDSENDNAVTLMTVHAAKGLEFPLIFVIAMEDGMFPNERAVQGGALDEERRLFYVAMTRAKKQLILTRAATRMTHGEIARRSPSPFLEDIPENLTVSANAKNAFQKVDADALIKALENFTV